MLRNSRWIKTCILLISFADRFGSKTNTLLGAGLVEDKEPGNAGEADAKGVSIIVLSGLGFGSSITSIPIGAFGSCKHLPDGVEAPVCRGSCDVLLEMTRLDSIRSQQDGF
jgi:hypothetical protein